MIFLYGKNQFLIEQKIKGFLHKHPRKELHFNESNSWNEIWFVFNNFSIFDEPRNVIIKNADFLLSKDKKFTASIIQAFKMKTNDFIFIVLEDDLPTKRPPLIEFLLEHTKTIRCPLFSYKEYHQIVTNIGNKYQLKITNLAIKMLIENFAPNFQLLDSEIAKMATEFSKIDDQVVKKLINLNEKIIPFAIFQALARNDLESLIKNYEILTKNELKTDLIIGQITLLFSLALQVNELKSKKFSAPKILETLKLSLGRFRQINYFLKLNHLTFIKKHLKSLLDADWKIKNGFLEPQVALNYWLLEYIKNIN